MGQITTTGNINQKLCNLQVLLFPTVFIFSKYDEILQVSRSYETRNEKQVCPIRTAFSIAHFYLKTADTRLMASFPEQPG